MGDLSKNFSRHEFACQGKNCCGHAAPIHPDLISGLQQLRDRVGLELTINSGFRCIKHNKEEDGENNSYHTLGMAADVASPEGMTVQQLVAAAETIPLFRDGGIGIYPNRVHLDVRKTGKARWRKNE